MPNLLKLVVMSDLHLLPEGQTQRGLDPCARFEQAIAQANALHGDADLCVFAGDIADRGEIDAYRFFERARRGYGVEQRALLGNHDKEENYLAVAVAPMRDADGHVQGVVDRKGHRILMVDSSFSRKGSARDPSDQGVLDADRLGWIRARLEEARALGLKVILVIHHNPAALQMPVDTYRLRDPDALLSVLRASGADIRLVIAGHCHIATAGSWGGYPCATLAGNQHHVEPFLRGRTGQQACWATPAQFAVIVSDGQDCVCHFQSYADPRPPMDPALFPRKWNQRFAPLRD